MKGGLLLEVAVSEGPSDLKLFPRKDQALLIRGDAFFILDLLLDVVDRVCEHHVQNDRLPTQSLEKDLHQRTIISRGAIATTPTTTITPPATPPVPLPPLVGNTPRGGREVQGGVGPDRRTVRGSA